MEDGTLQEFFFPSDLYNTYLIRNDYAVLGIIGFYLYFVKYWGPRFMKGRRPLELPITIRGFNVLLVLGNLYLCIKVFKLALNVEKRCNLKKDVELLDHVVDRMGHLAYQVLVIKIVELLDTVFFVLRRKTQHISFLHVFHHAMVVLLFWSIIKSRALSYYLVIAGTINCGVHVVMYTYYFLAAFGPSIQKYLWWKKYLTTLQILQFFVILTYMGVAFATGCEEFGTFEKLVFTLTCIVCALFLKFYHQSYRRSSIR